MTGDLLKNAFDRYFSIPLSFWNSIAELGEVVTIDKEKIIKGVNKTEHYLYLIIQGSGGILLWNKSNYVCTDLVLTGEFFCDYYSFITQKPTPYEVLTFEKSILFRISYLKLTAFTNENEHGDKFWRFATQALFIDKHNQFIQSFTSKAVDIYRLILQYQPELLNRIPQKYIASFLRITPQSLSRIRRTNKLY